MRTQLVAALRAVLVFTIVTGIMYPLAVTGVAQVAFGHRADGSLVRQDQRIVGSALIAQRFSGDAWFWPRPSAAGDGYDATPSGATNLGPTNPELRHTIARRAAAYRRANRLATGTPVPIDAVTASGSGLDPDISVANARLQAPRIARARRVPIGAVRRIIAAHTEEPLAGFIGTPHVNVLEANRALARAAKALPVR